MSTRAASSSAPASRVAPRCSPSRSFSCCSALRLPKELSPRTCNSAAGSRVLHTRVVANRIRRSRKEAGLFLFTRNAFLGVNAPFQAGVVTVKPVILAQQRGTLAELVFQLIGVPALLGNPLAGGNFQPLLPAKPEVLEQAAAEIGPEQREPL